MSIEVPKDIVCEQHPDQYDAVHESTAKAWLRETVSGLKSAYWDEYDQYEVVDEKHRDNYYRQVNLAYGNALADAVPTCTQCIDEWIAEHLSSLCIYSFQLTNRYNEKTSQNGTLLESGSEESLENISDDLHDEDQYPVSVVWGQQRELTTHEHVLRQFRLRVCQRKLSRTIIEDWMSWANEAYALMLVDHPDQEPGWYATRLVWKMTDEYRHRQTKKYRNSADREVELVLMPEDRFPTEDITVEHLMTTDEYERELTNTQMKTYNDIVDWARSDEEKMPKALRQRTARLPKVDTVMTVERVNRYNDQPAAQAGRDLRDDTRAYDFPVTTRRQAGRSKTLAEFADKVAQ